MLHIIVRRIAIGVSLLLLALVGLATWIRMESLVG